MRRISVFTRVQNREDNIETNSIPIPVNRLGRLPIRQILLGASYRECVRWRHEDNLPKLIAISVTVILTRWKKIFLCFLRDSPCVCQRFPIIGLICLRRDGAISAAVPVVTASRRGRTKKPNKPMFKIRFNSYYEHCCSGADNTKIQSQLPKAD